MAHRERSSVSGGPHVNFSMAGFRGFLSFQLNLNFILFRKIGCGYGEYLINDYLYDCL